MREGGFSGGCQCGAVRFRAAKLGSRPSICHCRMCQKATGNVFAPLVSVPQGHLEWTRGEPARFRSSEHIRRGFCAGCGTPLTYEWAGGVELMIGAFDRPDLIEPVVQVNRQHALPWIDAILEKRCVNQSLDETAITSFQHPDHDTPEAFHD